MQNRALTEECCRVHSDTDCCLIFEYYCASKVNIKPYDLLTFTVFLILLPVKISTPALKNREMLQKIQTFS